MQKKSGWQKDFVTVTCDKDLISYKKAILTPLLIAILIIPTIIKWKWRAALET